MSKFSFEEDGAGNQCLFWVNPWNGSKERIAVFYWPTHEEPKTRLVEEFYELLGKNCAEAAERAWAEINRMEESE